MIHRPALAKAALLGAAACMSFATAVAVPQFAAAQGYYDNPPPQPYYDPCARDQSNRAVAGGVLGGVAGAVIGNSLAHGGGKAGGTVLGGVAGAAAGAAIGHSTAGCQPGQYAQPAYSQAPPPPAYDDDYAPPPPPPPYRPQCANAEERVYFPDGTEQRSTVRACQDYHGRWYVAP